jgi:phosphoglycolate phosphatase
MWKSVFFDLDGTLTDSQEGIITCVRYALKEVGQKELTIDELYSFIGPPLIDSFQETANLSFDLAQKAVRKYRERYETIGWKENKRYPGVQDMLDVLFHKGFTLAVATSKPEIFAKRILQYFGMADYFSCICGSELDGRRNAKQEVIEEVIHRLGYTDQQKKEILMVGDRKQDIEGAKACGLSSAGVYYGFAQPGELEKAGADLIFQTADELKTYMINIHEK